MEEDSKALTMEQQSGSKMQTPGVMLREARRAKKLTQEEIAKQMRLNVQWIKDLESNDYSRAAALIYVRGYLRAYARLLDLSADDVIAAFEGLGLEEAFTRDRADEKVIKHQSVPIISKSTRVIVNRRMIHWITASAFVILIVLVGVWWQGQKRHGMQSAVMLQPKQEIPLQSTTTTTTTSEDESAPPQRSAMTEQQADANDGMSRPSADKSSTHDNSPTDNAAINNPPVKRKHVSMPSPRRTQVKTETQTHPRTLYSGVYQDN